MRFKTTDEPAKRLLFRDLPCGAIFKFADVPGDGAAYCMVTRRYNPPPSTVGYVNIEDGYACPSAEGDGALERPVIVPAEVGDVAVRW